MPLRYAVSCFCVIIKCFAFCGERVRGDFCVKVPLTFPENGVYPFQSFIDFSCKTILSPVEIYSALPRTGLI